MFAEPGWVIPAGRFERRYAALAVSDVRRGDRAYFKALHQQISGGGAEGMMWDLQRMDLSGWHPRDIPEALLRNPELQKQQGHTLPPLEQWYVMLLHNVPNALAKRPNTALPKDRREAGQVGRHPIPRHCAAHTRSLSEATNSTVQGGYHAWGFFFVATSRLLWIMASGPHRDEQSRLERRDEAPRIAANRRYAAETARRAGLSHEPLATTRRQPTYRYGDRDSWCRRFPGENRP